MSCSRESAQVGVRYSRYYEWPGQDAVRAIWGRNCRKASVIEIVVYNDHESRTLVNEGGTAEIFPFVPLHNAGE